MKPVKKVVKHFSQLKPYTPAPHPMQHRLDAFREIPSLWCGRIIESKN